jgi:hypothetical protein
MSLSKADFAKELQECHASSNAVLHAFTHAQRPIDSAQSDAFLARLREQRARSAAAEASALALQLEHGVALCGLMCAALQLAELELRFGVVPLGDADAIVSGYADVVKRLSEAARVFNSYGDRASLQRALHLLSIAYRRTLCHDVEIRVLDALVELERTDARVVALCDAYGRAIDVIFKVGDFETDDPSDVESGHIKQQNDDLMKLNYQFWLEYVWLKDQERFDFAAWVRQFRLPVFKMLIYISTMLGHALTAGFDAKNVVDADTASLEAMRVADLLDDGELRCVALARRTENRWPQYTDAEKRAALADLRAAIDKWKPQSPDLASTLQTLQTQYERLSTCATCSKPHAHQLCGRCRVVRYCGKECQVAAWPKHKKLCQHFVEAAQKAGENKNDPQARLDALKALSAITPVVPMVPDTQTDAE